LFDVRCQLQRRQSQLIGYNAAMDIEDFIHIQIAAVVFLMIGVPVALVLTKRRSGLFRLREASSPHPARAAVTASPLSHQSNRFSVVPQNHHFPGLGDAHPSLDEIGAGRAGFQAGRIHSRRFHLPLASQMLTDRDIQQALGDMVSTRQAALCKVVKWGMYFRPTVSNKDSRAGGPRRHDNRCVKSSSAPSKQTVDVA
jgi:hypothetical protein